MGAVLLAAAGTLDLMQGWASACLLYGFGAAACGAHLLYFLLGFERTGPLFVMLGSVLVKKFLPWWV